jgi:glutamate N-acetyltransferase/amino-acid N-acetyltransferase
MIHPNMATMLATLATDAAIAQPLLQKALSKAVSHSFNRISVDGDTSTNDTVLVLANGAAGNAEIVEEGADYDAFVEALTAASMELAKLIVRNGEGVTKFVTIQVEGAVSDDEAHQVANSIAKSPLVKTAFFGNDANWGRILCAVGYSGATVDPTKAHLFIAAGQPQAGNAELQLVDAGTPTNYAEKDAAAIFAESEISVRVSLGLGEGAATVWTCDLSYDYVSINAEYRS